MNTLKVTTTVLEAITAKYGTDAITGISIPMGTSHHVTFYMDHETLVRIGHEDDSDRACAVLGALASVRDYIKSLDHVAGVDIDPLWSQALMWKVTIDG